MEKSTTAWRTQGEWITHLHLEGKGGGTLYIKDKKKIGECGEACKTIEKAVQMVMGEHDTDVAEALYMVRGGGGGGGGGLHSLTVALVFPARQPHHW